MPPLNGYLKAVEEKDPTDLPLSLEEAKFKGRCRICGKKIPLMVTEEYPQMYDRYAGREIQLSSGEFVTLAFGSEYAHTACLIHGKSTLSLDRSTLK